jgi:hypothetical protein
MTSRAKQHGVHFDSIYASMLAAGLHHLAAQQSRSIDDQCLYLAWVCSALMPAGQSNQVAWEKVQGQSGVTSELVCAT